LRPEANASLRRRVEDARVARLATVGAGGRPHIVPICFALSGDVVYSAVDRKPKRSQDLKRLENVRVNARVAVLVDHYEDDWTKLWWVRLDGDARVLTEGPEHGHALELLTGKYPQYAVETPTGPVLAVAIERWHGWEHGESRS
jgi:PPOX class probable F420-dependent enzyme